MKNSKSYKILIIVISVVIVCFQGLCFVFNLPIEFNVIVDIGAMMASFLIAISLKQKEGVEKTKEEIKKDIKETTEKISNFVEKVQDNFEEKE